MSAHARRILATVLVLVLTAELFAVLVGIVVLARAWL
jgi:hypothetical protein